MTYRSVAIQELAAPGKNSLATGPFGSAVSSVNFRESGVPMLRGSNLSTNVGIRLLDENVVFVDQALADRFPRSVARRGDLVLTCWGTVGQVGFIGADSLYESYLVSNKQMKITPDAKVVDPLFLYYSLSQPSVQRQFAEQSIGSTIPGFNLGQLRSLRIGLPTLVEQQAIAEVLGALDDKIAANAEVAHTADALSSAVFEAQTSGYPPVALSAIASPVLGGTPVRDEASYWASEVPWASVRDVVDATAGVIISTEEMISAEGERNSRAKRVPEGSVILSARGTVGAVARLTMPAAFNQSCYAFVPDEVSPAQLLHLVRRAASQANQLAHGSVFSTITMRTMDALMVPEIPDDAVAALESRLAPLHALITAVVRESQTLAELRDTLLPSLMDGTIRVKDAVAQAEEVL